MQNTRFLVIVPILALADCGNDTKSRTFRGENGAKVTASIGGEGARWPADTPANAPANAQAYPGAALTSVMSSESDGTRSSMIGFETSDPIAKVVDRYNAQAAPNGLAAASTMTSGSASLFTAADKASGREFFVSASRVGGKTRASITFATKTPSSR